MSTITLEQATGLIDWASAVQVRGYMARYFQLGEEGETWFTVEWEDDEGKEFRLECEEDDNRIINVRNGSLLLLDSSGEGEWVKLLSPMHIPAGRRTFTVWCREADRSGTIFITSCEADDAEQAKKLCLQECLDCWNDTLMEMPTYTTENVVVLGVAEGDVTIVEWDDGYDI